MSVWVTEKQRFKLREHEAPSQVGWESGRGNWSGAQGGSWWGMNRASGPGEGLGPGNKGTGSGTFEQV